MGSYKSIFKLNGNVGGWIFYELNGKPVVRSMPKKKSGPKSKAQEESAFLNKEFGDATVAGKHLRKAMEDEFKQGGDRKLYQRLASLFVTIKNFDSAPKGEKTVAGGLKTPDGAERFAFFNFYSDTPNHSRRLSVTRSSSGLLASLQPEPTTPWELIELQVDLVCGHFRKEVHYLDAQKAVPLKKKFRNKKGFVTVFFYCGKRYMMGAVAEDQG